MMNETLLFLVDATQVGDFTEYTVDVHHNGNIWKVKHRYSEFKTLHDFLRLKYANIEKNLLPPKKLFGKMSPAFIDKRKKELEIYLQALINKTYPSGLPLVLRQFLHFHLYDVEMLCQNLAEKLYKVGDGILMSGSSYTFNTLELWAITERISLQKPHTDSENPSYDFGHVLDFIQKLKYLHIVCNRGYVGSSNIIAEDLVFDPSLFRSLTQIVADACSSEQAQSIAKLRHQLSSISVHQSVSSIQSLLSGGFDHMGSSESWNELINADFSDNQISVIDESMKLMPRIEFLDLSRNSISKIENLQHLTGLTFVDLSHNTIDEFECAHARLGNVKTLILAHNKLKSLRGLGKLYALEMLDLSHNCIAELKEVDHVAGLPCISKLNLSNNSVTTELDYRTQTLSKFASRACEVCLDEIPSTQKELDTAAVLHAIFKSLKLSKDSPNMRKNSSTSGKFTSSPIEIRQKKSHKSTVLSAPGRFCLTPDELDRARRGHFRSENTSITFSDSVATSSDQNSSSYEPETTDDRGNTPSEIVTSHELDRVSRLTEQDANVFEVEKSDGKRLSCVNEIDESIPSPVRTCKKLPGSNPDSDVVKNLSSLGDDRYEDEDFINDDNHSGDNDDTTYSTDDPENSDSSSAIDSASDLLDDVSHVTSDDGCWDEADQDVVELVEEILVVIDDSLNRDVAELDSALRDEFKSRSESGEIREDSDVQPCGDVMNVHDKNHLRKPSLDNSNDHSVSSMTLDDDWGESAWQCSLVVKSSDNETEKSPLHTAPAPEESCAKGPCSDAVVNGETDQENFDPHLTVEPVMNLEFQSAPLRHLALLSPPLLCRCRLLDMREDELLFYVTWSRVVFYEEPTNEISCAVFLSDQALYFVLDSSRESIDSTLDSMTVADLDSLKDVNQLTQKRFPFREDDTRTLQLVVGLFSQSVRVTGSNPTRTASLVTRSSYLTNNFVTSMSCESCVFKPEIADVHKFLNQSHRLQDTELELRNVTIALANEQAMMDFNLTTVDMWNKEGGNRSDSVPRLLLYLLVRFLSPPLESPKTFVLTSQFCCLCNENLISYPIPDFEFDSPTDHRYSGFEIVLLTDLCGLRLSNVVGYDLTILFSRSSSEVLEWRLSLRGYTERDKLLRCLCEQYHNVSGKGLNIHCAV